MRARTVLTRLAAGGVLLPAAFLTYMYVESRPTAEARDALRSDAVVKVTLQSAYATFQPVGERRAEGLLFLPGTPVDPVAYAPVARAVAERGYPAAIVFLPRRGLAAAESPQLASRASEAASAMGPERWVVAGHSRGGEFGSRLVLHHPGHYAGLVLIATTHPRSFSLANVAVDVTQVSGDRDGTTTDDELAAARANLPASARRVVIRGANHSQFGFYGRYPFDGTATISRAQQIAETVDVLLEALGRAAASSDSREADRGREATPQ